MLTGRKDYQKNQAQLAKEEVGKVIPAEMPVFLMKADDILFVPMLETYMLLASLIGCDRKLVQSVAAHLELAKLWNLSHPAKTPDL